MGIASVARIEDSGNTLRVTLDSGTVYHVPDDPENRDRMRVAQWEAGGGVIAEPTAGQRRATLKAERREQAIRYARHLERQQEAPHERDARLNRASLFAAALTTSASISIELEAVAANDLDTATYIDQLHEALVSGLTALNGLSTLAEIRAFDPRTDIAWPTPPA